MKRRKGKKSPRAGHSRPAFRKTGFCLLSLLIMVCMAGPASRDGFAGERNLYKALRSGGHVALMRHAIAPGTGDPSNFALGDCATQRNLSREGRDQAVEIGNRFRANGIDEARVFSSQWCRCLETAKRLALGPVQELPALNSFFRNYEREEAQTKRVIQWLTALDLKGPVVLVTHQVNITALTRVYPASGEIVVLRREEPGRFAVAGRIRPTGKGPSPGA